LSQKMETPSLTPIFPYAFSPAANPDAHAH
jgi:hypothetical protein